MQGAAPGARCPGSTSDTLLPPIPRPGPAQTGARGVSLYPLQPNQLLPWLVSRPRCPGVTSRHFLPMASRSFSVSCGFPERVADASLLMVRDSGKPRKDSETRRNVLEVGGARSRVAQPTKEEEHEPWRRTKPRRDCRKEPPRGFPKPSCWTNLPAGDRHLRGIQGRPSRRQTPQFESWFPGSART